MFAQHTVQAFCRLAMALALLTIATVASAADTVKLVIDYGDGVEKHFTQLAYKKDMTVLDAVRTAEKHAHGIKAEVRSSGSTAFLTQIDDVKNQGSGKNWVYRVNDKLGDRSIGIHKLQAGDAVLWRFQEFE
jgi:hypothetical protein